LTLGQRFGVIAILQRSIARHLRYVGALGVTDRLAAELPVGLTVVELSNEEKTFGRMVDVGKRLRGEYGADVVIMGCAGMARYRKPLQDAIGHPGSGTDAGRGHDGDRPRATQLDLKPLKPKAKPRHFSMIRDFHLADFITLANAPAASAVVLLAMHYLQSGTRAHFYAAAAMAPLAFFFDWLDGNVARWRHEHSGSGANSIR
jgi:hypothetical protein